MSAPLEQEVRTALAQAGLEPRSFRDISTLRTTEIDRVTYWVETADGREVKARRLEDAAAASTLFEIRRPLPDAFTRVLSLHDRVVLEEWVPGEVLGNRSPGAEHLAEAGRVLGELHGLAELGGRRLHQRCGTAAHREAAEASLRPLVAARVLEAAEAATLQQRMRRLDPREAPFGLVHFDFCGENMVIDRTGRLRVVDNDRVHRDALGFDLARAWYRWALPDAEWRSLESTYVACLASADPLHARSFWRLVAVVRAAALRLRVHPSQAASAIACLRRLSVETAS